MRAIRILLASLVLTVAIAGTAAAQTDPPGATGARASVRPGYSGHGLDVDVSIDSPLYAGLVRIRGAAGHGRWVDEFGQSPPVGLDPAVTRFAATVLFYGGPRGYPSARTRVRGYGGGGIAVILPRDGVDIRRQTGLRIVLGVEVAGSRWTAGPEVELDLPGDVLKRDPYDVPRIFVPGVDRTLAPAGRIGFAIRRTF